MKAITTKSPDFSPVTLSITFESKLELDAWASMLNLNTLVESFHKLGVTPVDPKILRDEGGDINIYTDYFANLWTTGF